MSSGQQLVLLMILLLALVPVWPFHRWLKGVVQPHRSLFRLSTYFLVMFAVVFWYAWLLVMLVLHLFPLPKR